MTTAVKQQTLQTSSVVAVYSTHDTAEAAVKVVQQQGFDITKLSVAGKDYFKDEHAFGYYAACGRMVAWGKFGAFWRELWGTLHGAAVFFVPRVGFVAIAGPLSNWTVAALEGGVIVDGLSALGAALVAIGILKDSAFNYESELHAGRIILIVHGTSQETDRARALLESTRYIGLTEHE